MKTGLTKKQKNTELYFNAKDPMTEIYTHDTKLKRRLWILAICEIVLLAVILAMVIIGSEINHSLLMSIE